MGKDSKIQWTDHTWNAWQGCRKVSPGCKFCYMYRDKTRYNQDPTKVIRSSDETFYKPYKWKEGSKIFVNSWSDFFIEEADGKWRRDAFDTMLGVPRHTYQILTKRPERIQECLDAYNMGWFVTEKCDFIWFGISAENEEMFRKRMKHFGPFKTKGVKFVSVEPLLEPLNLKWAIRLKAIDWIIIGGESGNENGPYKYRECKLEWIEDIVIDAKVLGVPVFVKQLGTHLAKKLGLKDRHGGDIDEWPEHLQIREFPE